jgi:hypothetical protein
VSVAHHSNVADVCAFVNFHGFTPSTGIISGSPCSAISPGEAQQSPDLRIFPAAGP